MRQQVGVVTFVGTGSGAETLLTVRAVEALRSADAVIYDPSTHAALVHLAPPTATRIAVETAARDAAASGEGEASIVIQASRKSARVVRLIATAAPSCRPLWSEARALADQQIPFEVVPEVPPALAWPIYAGIPLTRGDESHVTLAMLDTARASGDAAPRWGDLLDGGTLIIRTEGSALEATISRLVGGGARPDTPAAVIAEGGSPRQRVVIGPLGRVVELGRGAQLDGTLIVIVGDDISPDRRVSWFERRPLFGRRIVVTRARAQAAALTGSLRDLGAEVLELPTIRIEPPSDTGALDAAVARLGDYDWIVFTSANGVRCVFERLTSMGLDARRFGRARVCAIGPATARALADRGITADLVPQRFVAESLVGALRGQETIGPGSRVLIARAAEARELLPEALSATGAKVDLVAAYQTVPDGRGGGELARRIIDGEIDWITFTSSSTVRNFVRLVGREAAACRRFHGAVIGPITAQTAREAGIEVAVEATEYTVPGLVRALVDAEVSRAR